MRKQAQKSSHFVGLHCTFPHLGIGVSGLGHLDPSSHHSKSSVSGSSSRQPDNPLFLVFLAVDHLLCPCGGQRHLDSSILTAALQMSVCPPPPPPTPAGSAVLVVCLAFRGHCPLVEAQIPVTAAAPTSPQLFRTLLCLPVGVPLCWTMWCPDS